MEKPIEDPAKETKERIRDLIIAILPYNEFDRANGASKVANHLIDELVARVQTRIDLAAEKEVLARVAGFFVQLDKGNTL